MKNIFLALTISILCISCQRDSQQNENLQTLSKDNVAFVNYKTIISKFKNINSKKSNKLHINNIEIDGGGVGFEFILGRKSRNCHGFGICEVSAFWIDIWESKDEKLSENNFTGLITKTSNLSVKYLNSNEYSAFLFLAKEIDNRYDTAFIIDEDVFVDKRYIIKKGIYLLDDTLGKYGGYQLNVEKL